MIQVCGVQILTSEQNAKLTVYAYPQTAKPEGVLNQLAAERQEPSVQTLLDDTSVDDFQHAANWQEVVQYLTNINLDTVHTHIPLLGD